MFYWLATEAGAADLSETAEGFGLNFDILEANLINLAIVIGIVVYFGRGFLGSILSERQSAIESEIRESEERNQQATQALKAQKEKVAQAEAEAKEIVAAAQARSATVKEDILAQAIQDIQRLEEGASQDQSSSQERAIAELRQRVVELALEKVEQDLQGRLSSDEEAQRKLIDRSIALLGG